MSAGPSAVAELQSLCIECAEFVAGGSDILAIKPYDANPSTLQALYTSHTGAITRAPCSRCCAVKDTARVTIRRRRQ